MREERKKSDLKYFRFEKRIRNDSVSWRISVKIHATKREFKEGRGGGGGGIVSKKLTNRETFVLSPEIQSKWNTKRKSGKQQYWYISFYILLALEYTCFMLMRYLICPL